MKFSRQFHITLIFTPAKNHFRSKVNYKHNLSECSFEFIIQVQVLILTKLMHLKRFLLVKLCLRRMVKMDIFARKGLLVVEEGKRESRKHEQNLP